MGLLEQASLVITPTAVKAGKLYAIKPNDGTGDLDVTRATTATRVNSAGLIESVGNNIARLDYTNASCPSILVEPQRTNLFLWSDMFTNASWNKSNTTVSANTITSPSGLQDADKLSETVNTNYHGISSLQTVAVGTVYTISIFVKKGTRRYVGLECFYNTSRGNIAFFDLDTNSLLYQFSQGAGYSITNSKIEVCTNGWVRLSASVTFGDTDAYPGLSLANTRWTTGTSYNNPYAGNVNEFVNIWGAQFEVGSNATSYIPTTISSVTRNADSISKSGIIDLIGQTEGSIYVEFDRTTETLGFKALVVIYGDNWLTNSLYIQTSFNSNIDLVIGFIINSTKYQSSLSPIKGKNKLALVYDTTGCDIFLNGVKLVRRSLPSFPSVYNLHLFNSPLNRQYGSGYLFSLWKTKLSDQQAIQLTTL